MSLRLIVGRANAGKTGILHRVILDAAADGQPLRLILPSSGDVRRARSEFAVKAPVGVTVSTFDEWVRDLWVEMGDGRRLVNSTVRQALLGRAVDETRLSEIDVSAQTPGFIRVMSLVVARLCNPTGQHHVPGDVREVGAVVERYEKILESLSLVEPARAAWQLADSVAETGATLVANRFSDLSEAQELLLLAASRSGVVNIGLTWEEGFSATEALTPLVERFIAEGASVVHCPVPDDHTELDHLGSRIFAPPYEGFIEATTRVEFGSAAGDEAEIELIAETVQRIVVGGTPPDRVAVVFRRPGTRPRRLATALGERGIEMDDDFVLTIGHTDFGRALLGLLSVAGGNGSRADILAFLHSPYSGVASEAVAEVDRMWRRSRTTDCLRLLESGANLAGSAHRAIEAAIRISDGPVDRLAVSDWKELADVMLESALTSRNRLAGTTCSEDLADAAVHRSVLRSAQEAAELGGAITSPEVASALADVTVGPRGAERPGAVQFLDATRARSRRFDAVILGGLTAAEFSAERPEPIQARLERALGGKGGTEERLSERMLFYSLITRAREKLVLVRQSSDSSGETVRPSVFWEDVVDCYVPPSDAGELPVIPPGVPHSSLLLSDLADAVPAFAPHRRQLRGSVERGEAIVERALSSQLGPSQQERAAEKTVFSVTELENYAQCPYRWFVERVVRPREIDTVLDAREMGNRAHEMLALFYRRLPEQLGATRVEPSNVDDCLALFDGVSGEVEAGRRRGGPTSLSEELDMARAKNRARSVIEQDADFLPGYDPVATELEFEVPIPVGDTAVTVRGKIDRIDAGPAGILVTDYKLGDVCGRDTWVDRRMLQVALYADIAGRTLERPVAGGVYRSLKTGSARGFWRADLGVPLGEGHSWKDATDEAGVDETVAWAREQAVASIVGMCTGIIGPEPVRKEACSYCMAVPFCPKVLDS